MKSYGLKKRIAAMMTVSVLAIWFALPNVANAQTITIEGRNIYVTLVATSSSATATITYTEGSGQVKASTQGFAHHKDTPALITPVSDSSSNPTPGGATASISLPSGYSFISVYSSCEYEVYINGTTYKDTISDSWNF